MAPNAVDPGFWQSEKVAKLSMFERYLFLALIYFGDSQGRMRAGLIRSKIFPFDDITSDEIQAALEAIKQQGGLSLYIIHGRRYVEVLEWRDYIPPSPSPSDPGSIYFIKSDTGLTKIGLSRSVAARLTALKAMYPDQTLQLIRIVKTFNMLHTERQFHGLFQHLRVYGEWFLLATEDYIMVDREERVISDYMERVRQAREARRSR